MLARPLFSALPAAGRDRCTWDGQAGWASSSAICGRVVSISSDSAAAMIAGHAGDHEGELVVALQLAHGAAEEGRGRRAELVAGDDPAEHQRPAAVAERLVG